MTLRSLRSIPTAAWLAASLAAQGAPEAFPPASAFPEGVVVAADGTPVAGATVRLAVGRGDDWNRAVAQRLARAPLPEVVSQADGTFVLPLLPEMRPIGGAYFLWNAPRGPRVWLIVEAEGFLPWREPIEQGLEGYLGSRVVLRPDVADDPFRDVPWPPALAEIAYPWWDLDAPHPATSATRAGHPETLPEGAGEPCAVTLTVRGEAGRPIPRAQLLFADSAWTAGSSLPLTTDGEGRAALRIPPGEHWLRVRAPGCATLARSITVASPRGTETQHLSWTVPEGEWVDIVAIDQHGRSVGFAVLNLVSQRSGAEDLPPFVYRTDSLGRLRCSLPDPGEYFVYADVEDPALGTRRIPLGVEGGGAGGPSPVLVRKQQSVTIVLDVDGLAPAGEITWPEPDGGRTMRAFWAAPVGKRIVTRVLSRDQPEVRFALERRPGLALRVAEMPPEPADPLLDLVRLDRTLRRRGILVPETTAGAIPSSLRVEPHARWLEVDGSPFDEVEGQWLRRREGRLEVWARDDGPLDLVLLAPGFTASRFAIPAREGDEVPTVPVTLEPR